MSGDATRPDGSGSSDELRDVSGSRLFFVWVLLAPSFAGLAWDVQDAATLSLPLSQIGASLLFGTLVVCALWVANFRPSLPACLAYFVGQLGIQLVLVASAGWFVPGATGPGGWGRVALRALSIGLAGPLAFSARGATGRYRLRKQLRQLLRLPPVESSERNSIRRDDN